MKSGSVLQSIAPGVSKGNLICSSDVEMSLLSVFKKREEELRLRGIYAYLDGNRSSSREEHGTSFTIYGRSKT